jgi:hypothetical protein
VPGGHFYLQTDPLAAAAAILGDAVNGAAGDVRRQP